MTTPTADTLTPDEQEAAAKIRAACDCLLNDDVSGRTALSVLKAALAEHVSAADPLAFPQPVGNDSPTAD